MVTTPSDLAQVHARLAAAMFPATSDVAGRSWSSASQFLGGDPDPAMPGQFWSYFITVVDFSEFAPAWPITPSWPYAIRGLRGSMEMSQAAFASLCKLGKATVERWESGKTVPLRGNALKLLSFVRPHLAGPIQAGQALNLAAAAVLPKITRPTGEYSGLAIRAWLQEGADDHRDLAGPLLHALATSRILIATGRSDEPLQDTYVPLVGRGQTDDPPVWAHELVAAATALSRTDRDIILDLARRLAQRQR